ncbi:MAG TPA: hypothetical protein VFW11_19430 [Cyclobacteriaceae bacterium]|nr:hypothetical protein [Cyclobacteriaceae bacterium]
MIRKFFPRDKNYILEQAQLSLEQSLLNYLLDFVKVEYLLRNNSLGIDDNLSRTIKQHNTDDYRHLHEFYFSLMAIFRFEFYGDNQLVFDFDGKEPFERYRDEWSVQFKKWTKEFCKHQNFLRAVLDLTVFYPVDSAVLLMDTRMQTFISQFFGVKIHPQKGISRKSVA